MSASTEKKRQKQVMPLIKKIELLDRLKSGESVASVSRIFKVNESTVRYIKKKEDDIRRSVKEGTSQSSKVTSVCRDYKIEKMEKALNIWIEDRTQKRMPISTAIIREKALRLYNHFVQQADTPIDKTAFSASKGWFENFKKRFSLHNVQITGEASSADHEAASSYPNEFYKIIIEKGYVPEQVFNADETGLFWKKMPSRTFISKQEKFAPGFKAAKDRLTVLLCCNPSGFMLKPMVVYKSLNPRALKRKDKNKLPVLWKANKKAWVTSAVFTEWFDFFVKETERYLKSKSLPFKVLLVIDNAPGHPVHLNHPNVEVIFLPPNTTALLQPLDQGIIAAFKAYYLRRNMNRLFCDMEENVSLIQSWKNYNIADGIRNITESVNEIELSTMNGCWRKLWPEAVLEINYPTSDETVVTEIVSIARNIEGDGFEEIEVADILQMLQDDNNEMTEEDLEELIENNSLQNDDEEQEDEVITPTLNLKEMNEIFRLAKELTVKVSEVDPSLERSIKFSREIDVALAPYKEVRKELEHKKKQTKITSFFNSS
jgi:hypothetical protein